MEAQQDAQVITHDRANVKRVDYPTVAEWLRARRTAITSTDVAALSGLAAGSPLSVFEEKLRQPSPEDENDEPLNDRMLIGKLFQKDIATAYQIVRGKKEGVVIEVEHVPNTTLFFHARRTRHATSMDAWQAIARADLSPLECKNTGNYPDEPLDFWLTQVQWQMHVTGSQMATIACMCGGDTLRWWDVARDDEVIEILEANAESFLENHVDRLEAPASDGSVWSRGAMRRLYPQSVPSTLVELGADDLDAALRILALGDEIDGLEKEKAMCEDSIKQKMGVAESAFLPNGYRISWKAFEKRAYEVKAQTVRPFRIVKPKVK